MQDLEKIFFRTPIHISTNKSPEVSRLLKIVDSFLRKANLNTYANTNVHKSPSQRPGSVDYHFEEGDLIYHDTYFGSTRFIGGEIIYQNSRPIWGMNYYGFTLDEKISEQMYDEILRPALMSGSGKNIPVRGPEKYVNDKWVYTFEAKGDLENFMGVEEINNNSSTICRLYCHGGLIR